MDFVLGLLAGSVIGVLGTISGIKIGQNPPVPVKRAMRVISATVAPRGSVIEPKSEEVLDMEEMFASNDKKGKDTDLGELWS